MIDHTMGSLPAAIVILMTASLSALAGALSTWLVIHAKGEGRQSTARHSSPDEQTASDDLLRVTRTKDEIAIFVQGRRLRHLREIEDREVGQETISAIKAVLAFAEGWLPALHKKRGSSHAATRGTSADDLRVSLPVRQEPLVAVKRARGATSSEPLELIEEIDALIQSRLAERPDLTRQGIRLTRDVDGHPLIYVGQKHYRSADEIPNDEIRTFVYETIQIWESQ